MNTRQRGVHAVMGSGRRAAVVAATVVVVVGILVSALWGRLEARSAARDQLGPESGRPVALVIGDSQAHGARDTQVQDTWVSRGLVTAGYGPVVLGEAGTGFLAGYDGAPSYLDGLRQGKYTLPGEEVSLVVVEGGGNDDEHPDERIVQAAQACLDLLQEHYPGADIVVVGPLGRGDDARRLEINELLAQLAQDEGVLFLDAGRWGHQHQLEGLFHDDGVHLTAAGHQRLAGPFAAQLEALELGPTG